ncbi:hypothetical protein [Porphyrobacter sp. GA68]|uniref:hypothetical protein n=1 Tax=Porphyrobacter sp. GA68 TaxID=2883480 RepID=UPI001D19364B|nr:hypothetical protein [Porphyrobacter sp. GA68]
MKMFFRKPKLSVSSSSSSYDLLQDAFMQYHIKLHDGEMSRRLSSLKMDDIDFLESLQMIEKAIGSDIDKAGITPSTTISELIRRIDRARVS